MTAHRNPQAKYLTAKDIENFRTESEIVALMQPVISRELEKQDRKFDVHRSDLMNKLDALAKEVNGTAIRVNEIYANGSGGPKGMLEKMDARIDQLIKESWSGKEKTMTAMLNFMHIQEEEAKKNEMRAELAKEYAEKYEKKQTEEAAKHERRNKTIIVWVKWAVGLVFSEAAFDVLRTIWHTYHPIVVDHVINK